MRPSTGAERSLTQDLGFPDGVRLDRGFGGFSVAGIDPPGVLSVVLDTKSQDIRRVCLSSMRETLDNRISIDWCGA